MELFLRDSSAWALFERLPIGAGIQIDAHP